MPKGTPNQYTGDFESLMSAMDTTGGLTKQKIKPVPFPTSRENILKLGYLLPSEQYRALWFHLYLTGQRISEAVGLPNVRTGVKYDDFARPNQEYLTVKSYTEKNRIQPFRHIPIKMEGIQKEMGEVVIRYAEKYKEAKQLFSCSRQAACAYFKYHLEFEVEAVININDPKTRGIQTIKYKPSPHYLRHCLIGSTRIMTSGGIVRAEEAYFKDTDFTAIDKQLKQISVPVTHKLQHNAYKLLTISAGGREITCTPEHPLFTLSEDGLEEIEANDIKKGMFLAGITNLKRNNIKKYYDPKLWRLLGYFTGDGCFHQHTKNGKIGNVSLELADQNTERIRYYCNLCEELKIAYKVIQHHTANSQIININSAPLSKLIKRLGLHLKSGQLQIPTSLFQATKEEICEFLAGFYDAEGNNGGDSYRYFSANKHLLKDIQMLLLYFEIQSSLNESVRTVKLPNGKLFTGPMSYLMVYDYDSKIKHFQLIPTLKKVNIKPRKKNVVKNSIIPVSMILSKIYDRRKNTGLVVSFGKNSKLSLKRGGFTKNSHPTKKTLEALISYLINEPEYPLLKRLLDGEVCWLKVKSVRNHGGYHNQARKDAFTGIVYDFEVPTYENFVADGFISHNCRLTHLVEFYDFNHMDLMGFAGWSNPNIASTYVHFNWRTLAKSMQTENKFMFNESVKPKPMQPQELKPSETQSVINLSGPIQGDNQQ